MCHTHAYHKLPPIPFSHHQLSLHCAYPKIQSISTTTAVTLILRGQCMESPFNSSWQQQQPYSHRCVSDTYYLLLFKKYYCFYCVTEDTHDNQYCIQQSLPFSVGTVWRAQCQLSDSSLTSLFHHNAPFRTSIRNLLRSKTYNTLWGHTSNTFPLRTGWFKHKTQISSRCQCPRRFWELRPWIFAYVFSVPLPSL